METPARFRQRFPSLADTVHLASCSQGAASQELTAALTEMQHLMHERGAPWDSWTAEVDRARAMFAERIGARSDEVAIVPCASDAAYQVASTRSWSSRPKVVTCDAEFPSIAHVWLAQRPRGADVVQLPEHEGWVSAEEYAAVMGEDVALVSVPLASYRNGALLPAAEVATLAHDVGARVFVDAYQAAGVVPIDVDELGCDFLVSGSLKYLLGLPGIAFLYVRDGVEDEVPPQLTGWFGRANPYAFDPHLLDFADGARRFETGTPSIPSVYAAVAGMRCLARVDPADVIRHVRELTGHAHDALTAAGERIRSPSTPSLRGAQVAVVDDDPTGLAAHLAARGIATSPRGQVVRLAFHYYNDESDVARVCEAIAEYRRWL